MKPIVFYFAGVGDDTITAVEEAHCRWAAARCIAVGGWLYSGNCCGADVAFQRGARERSTAWLPWAGFGYDGAEGYDATRYCGEVVIAGDDPAGRALLGLHPQAKIIPRGGRARAAHTLFAPKAAQLLTRDACQVIGDDTHPPVEVVICCATPQGPAPHVRGGTGQAVRVAVKRGIPVVNVRLPGWEEELDYGLAGYRTGDVQPAG